MNTIGIIEKTKVPPSYWHTPVSAITVFTQADENSLKEAILSEDYDADCARFGIDEEGTVFWWNGRVNHSGAGLALGKIWILTGIWNFKERLFTSNNNYTQKQLDTEARSEAMIKALNRLRIFSKDIRKISMHQADLNF